MTRPPRVSRLALAPRALLAGAALLAACSSDGAPRPVAPVAVAAPERVRTRRPPAPAEWYWEAVEPELHDAEPHPLELPVSEAGVGHPEGAAKLWSELGEAGRDRVRRDGFVVAPAPAGARPRVGAFYMEWRERRVPLLLTVDALYAASVLAISRAVTEVEKTELAPALEALVAKLASRLDGAGRPAQQELLQPHRLARGVLAVAAFLANGTPAPPDLAPLVAQEVGAIVAHAGAATSPLLGVPIDYARFRVPAGAASPGHFRAATWLGAAPFVLAARTETRGAAADVMLARTHARAAMLLSRYVDRDVDPETSDAYARVARLVGFVWGSPDDLSLVELGDLAEALKVDLAKAASIASVTRTDLVRHRAALLRPPQVYDGSGGLTKGDRPPVSVRILGGHASPDAQALGTLVTGGLAAERPLPSLLDVAAWLGAPGVRTTLREAGEATPGHEEALARAVALRPGEDDPARHGSIHGSLLDVLLTWAEAKEAGARSVATERARTESLLAAWTLARSAGRPFARAAARSQGRPRELDLTGTALPVFVEPAPDAIAHLASAVRQANKGLGALGRLEAKSPYRTALAEVEDMLLLALRAATRSHDGDPIAAEDATALLGVPARLLALEGEQPDADVVAAVEVAAHPRTGHTLVAGVAGLEPAYVLVKDTTRETARDPSKEGPREHDSAAVLAVGAHLVLTDRTPWLSTFRVTRDGRAKP